MYNHPYFEVLSTQSIVTNLCRQFVGYKAVTTGQVTVDRVKETRYSQTRSVILHLNNLPHHTHYSSPSTMRTLLGPQWKVLYSETSINRTPWGPQWKVLYSETSINRTPWGPQWKVLYSETSINRTPWGPQWKVLQHLNKPTFSTI